MTGIDVMQDQMGALDLWLIIVDCFQSHRCRANKSRFRHWISFMLCVASWELVHQEERPEISRM
jgi:hypothetical protein